jgi:NTE family protein
VFGRDGAPAADVADAVTASCAVPAFFRPVTIDERRYIDGGVWSPSNLDVLHDAGLDLVVCLNPTSSRAEISPSGPREWLSATWRRTSGRRLGWEAKRLRAVGTEVVLIQPEEDDLTAMGPNLMRRGGVSEVIEVARRTTAEQLREAETSRTLLALGRARGPRRGAAPAG